MQPPVHSDGGTVQHGGQVGKGASRIVASTPCTMRGPYIELMHTSDVPSMQRRPTILPSQSYVHLFLAPCEGKVHRDAPKVEHLPSVRIEHAKHAYVGSFAISSWMGNI